jgi:thioredoxin-like negative regulator of GroEL
MASTKAVTDSTFMAGQAVDGVVGAVPRAQFVRLIDAHLDADVAG